MRFLIQRLFIFLLLAQVALSREVVVTLYQEQEAEMVHLTLQEVEPFIQEKLADLELAGYWQAQARIVGTSSDSISVRITPGDKGMISELHFPRMPLKWAAYYEEYALLGDSVVTHDELEKVERWLSTQGVSNLLPAQLTLDGGGKYHLIYSRARQPDLRIDAMAAFNQASGADTLAWFGNIHLIIPNIMGSGKRVELFWKRLKTDSEQFSLRYRHPHLFARSLTAEVQFARDVKEGNYQFLTRHVALEYAFSWDRSLALAMEEQTSLITLKGSLAHPEWQAGRHRYFGLSYFQDGFDVSRQNGFAIRSSLWREMNFEPTSISRLSIRAEWGRRFTDNLYLKQRHVFYAQDRWGDQNDPGLLKGLGGEGTVRGYAEDHVLSRTIYAVQHDLGFRVGQDSRIFGVYDLGAYQSQGQIKYLYGFGLGMQLRSSKAPLRVIFASHPGLGIGYSFLHIEYIGIRKWIDRS